MTAAKPYALSVKAVVCDVQGRCLLLRRSASSKANAGKWEFPGGKLDPGERVDQALEREVAEETGLTVTVRRVVGAAESELAERKIAYLILEATCGTNEVILSEEHDRFLWVAPDSLPNIDLSPQFRPFAMIYAQRLLQRE
jgi:8-oxo-dGTP diphosphatase